MSNLGPFLLSALAGTSASAVTAVKTVQKQKNGPEREKGAKKEKEKSNSAIDASDSLTKDEAKSLKKIVEKAEKKGTSLKIKSVKRADKYNSIIQFQVDPTNSNPYVGGPKTPNELGRFLAEIMSGAADLIGFRSTGDGSVYTPQRKPPIARSGYCNDPRVERILRKAAEGQWDYDSSDPHYHAYCHATLLGKETQSGKMTLANAFRLLRKYPAPLGFGQEVRVVSTGDTSDLLLVGLVSHKLIPERHTIINYTVIDEHHLHPGGVARVAFRLDGFLYIGTFGEGVASIDSAAFKGASNFAFPATLLIDRGILAMMNEQLAETTWGDLVDSKIVREINQ